MVVAGLLVVVYGCDVLPPGGGDGGDLPALIPVHAFEYDEASGNYIVAGKTVSTEDVQRDLVGSLCSECHTDAVGELKDSVHYKTAGRTDRILFPGGGSHGMLDRACGLPSTTGLTNYTSDVNLGECGKCHVGRYLPVMEGFFTSMFTQMGVADPLGQAEQLVNAGLDCLICHADSYRSYPEGDLAVVAGYAPENGESPTSTGFARVSRDNADFNCDGEPDLVIDMDGDGVMDAPLMFDSDGDGMPDTPWATIAQDRGVDAIASIGATTAHACLRCHEHARTGYKRGTLFAEGFDIHSTLDTGVFADQENNCTVCHTASHHKFVRGHMVGGDLGAADYPPPPPGVAPDPDDPTDLTCQSCHDASSLPPAIHTEIHLAAISCETCHIPYSTGITYSLFGHGAQLSFGRNEDGKDTRLITADHYIAGDRPDLEADFEAYKVRPTLMWFNGGTSFLAQSLAVRGMPNAKITPFKPMANGMAFDSRFFNGTMATNGADAPYNAHSMYQFFANGNNAEAFFALDMLDMTPDDVRKVTMADFRNADPEIQTMAMMLIFPNLVYFDKANYGYEHYLTRTGSPWDANGDGVIDEGQPFMFDMLEAANSGLRQFMGFNGPMGFPADYQWYAPYENVSDVISMKLPDGSLMKMFLQMQAEQMSGAERDAFLRAVQNYPSFSQITLGGHGVVPKEQALGASSCMECHGPDGVLAHTIPVGQKVPTDMGEMGLVELPVYSWTYYNVGELINLGLRTSNEEIVAGQADIDIDGQSEFSRGSSTTFVLNWMMPNAEGGYRPADAGSALAGTDLTANDLTWSGGDWMPVLEPVTDLVPNYAVLGYAESEIIWR
jgi:hypothetical protein